ncbi:collagen-like protein [Streptomyces sp. NPDC054871]
MTRTQHALARSWKSIAVVAALLFLGGAVLFVYLQIQSEADRADHLATEADLRGTAVSTLAGDVRQLRSQLKATGEEPAVPDPSKAVEDLPDRAEVPVPIPGRPGPKGDRGPSGKPAPTITPSDGEPGSPGTDGADGADGVPGAQGPQGETGPAGPQGEQGPTGERGPAGEAGADGRDGQNCPDGYSLQPPADDPDALICRRDSAPPPDDPENGPQAAALDPQRRQY